MALPRLHRPVLQSLLHRPHKPISHSLLRTITNATKPDHIPDLLRAPRVPAKPGNWHPTLIHSSGTCKFSLIRVPPGGRVPNHLHTANWDYFVALAGRGVITTTTTSDGVRSWDMPPGAFLAVGPGDVHVVRNAVERADGEEFVFCLCQSPRAEYDFIAVEEGRSEASENERGRRLKGEHVWDGDGSGSGNAKSEL